MSREGYPTAKRCFTANQIEDLVERIRFSPLSWPRKHRGTRLATNTHPCKQTHNALSLFFSFWIFFCLLLCSLLFATFQDSFVSGFKWLSSSYHEIMSRLQKQGDNIIPRNFYKRKNVIKKSNIIDVHYFFFFSFRNLLLFISQDHTDIFNASHWWYKQFKEDIKIFHMLKRKRNIQPLNKLTIMQTEKCIT